MSSHEAYLRSALTKYQYADIAKRDITAAIQQFADLRPKMDHFVFNDGTKKELLCLDGTIPVSYKGMTYNIPLCLWLMDTHPYNPPMGFVKPTNTMQIKPGRHVDNNGKIYLPYLHEWKHPHSDLLGLIQILTIVFGEEPPVFAKSSSSPAVFNPGVRSPYPPPSQSTNLPYPAQGGGMPSPAYPAAAGAANPARYQAPGGYPPQQPSAGFQGYPQQYPPQATPQAQQQQQQQTPYPGMPEPYNASFTQRSAAVTTAAAANTISADQIKASLLSAVEDKMRRRLRDVYAQSQAEMDSLTKTQDDLQKGKRTLDDMLQKMEKEQNEVERNITLLQEKDEEMSQALAKMDRKEEVGIDEAVQPTAPLYRQLLNSYAEEQATEDAIYYLGEALRKSVIELDVFLKQIRELSRKQFMLRALIHKCRQKAGLPDLTG